jgi:hypothetical protein
MQGTAYSPSKPPHIDREFVPIDAPNSSNPAIPTVSPVPAPVYGGNIIIAKASSDRDVLTSLSQHIHGDGSDHQISPKPASLDSRGDKEREHNLPPRTHSPSHNNPTQCVSTASKPAVVSLL